MGIDQAGVAGVLIHDAAGLHQQAGILAAEHGAVVSVVQNGLAQMLQGLAGGALLLGDHGVEQLLQLLHVLRSEPEAGVGAGADDLDLNLGDQILFHLDAGGHQGLMSALADIHGHEHGVVGLVDDGGADAVDLVNDVEGLHVAQSGGNAVLGGAVAGSGGQRLGVVSLYGVDKSVNKLLHTNSSF